MTAPKRQRVYKPRVRDVKPPRPEVVPDAFKDPSTWTTVIDGADLGASVPCEVCAANGDRCPHPGQFRAFVQKADGSVDFSLKVCRKHAKILSLQGHRVPGVEECFPQGWGTGDVDAVVKPGVRPYKVRGRGARTMRDVLVLAASDAGALDFNAWAKAAGMEGIDMPCPLPAPLVAGDPGWVIYPDEDEDETPNAATPAPSPRHV